MIELLLAAADVLYVQLELIWIILYDLYDIKCEHRISVIPSYALWSIQLSHKLR